MSRFNFINTTIVIIFLVFLGSCDNPNKSTKPKVKNIILFIGDGMGSQHLTISSYHKFCGKDNLNIEKMPVTGFVKTHAANDWITDSASGATAMATGHKTNVGMVSVTPDSISKETIMEKARKLGKKTGIVATSHITDATPACFVSHASARSMKNIIAEQIIESETDVILGGGIEFFLPQSDSLSARDDDKNLIKKAIDLKYQFVEDSASLAQINHGKVLGLFSVGGMNTTKPEPSIAQMTKKAIQLLEDADNGFILMVEGNQIDWEAHSNNLDGVIKQTLLFDEAVKVGLDFAAENNETLVLVTADHETGGITLTGDDRENPFSFNVKWGTGGHTGIPIPIFGYGPGSYNFSGVIDNTEIAKKIFRIIER